MARSTKKVFDRFSHLSDKELRQQGNRFLDLKRLFPKGKPNLRIHLNKYQAAKIRGELREVEKIADGAGIMQRDFVPLKNAKKYYADQNKPEARHLKGVFMTGGERDNKQAEYTDGELLYRRGGARRIFKVLNNWSERILIKELKEAVASLPKTGKKYLTANGRVMFNNLSYADTGAMEAQARITFNKYKDMAARGEIRANGSLAAHPKKWGIGVLWEERKAPPKKSASQAWVELTDEQQAGWKEGAQYFKSTNFEAFKKVYNSKKK